MSLQRKVIFYTLLQRENNKILLLNNKNKYNIKNNYNSKNNNDSKSNYNNTISYKYNNK